MPRLLPILRLLRIGTLFSPAADVLASFCIAGLAWQPATARAMGASVALYAAGMVWNDIADRKLDAIQRPERPLPRSDLSLAFALSLGIALLLGGMWLSPCRWHHGLIAALVLLYDFAGKRVEWLGALLMGSLRGLNLLTGLAFASAADSPGLPPAAANALWTAAGCYAIYITAVTLLGIFEDTPRVSARAVSTIQAAPPLAALAGIFAVQGALWPAPALALLPVLWFARRNRNRRQWDQAAIRASMTFLLLGTMLYTALLALAAGEAWASLGIAAAIAPARWISRRIALT